MVFLHENFRKTKLVSDSQYAIDSWKRVLETTDINLLDFQANSDLLIRLFFANRQSQHEVYKVQSHVWDFGSREECPCYDTLGNELVDQVAKSANVTLNPALYHDWEQCQQQLKQDLDRRKKHYEMLGKLRACQANLSDQRERQEQGSQIFMGQLGRSVYDVMATYTPSNFSTKMFFGNRTLDVDLDFPWTSETSAAILQFWSDIQWSHETQNEIGLQGISWTELTISFLLDRNISIPTKIPHTNHWAMSLAEVKNGGWGFLPCILKAFSTCVEQSTNPFTVNCLTDYIEDKSGACKN